MAVLLNMQENARIDNNARIDSKTVVFLISVRLYGC